MSTLRSVSTADARRLGCYWGRVDRRDANRILTVHKLTGMKTKLTPAMVDQLVEGARQGKSAAACARSIGFHKSNMSIWLRAANRPDYEPEPGYVDLRDMAERLSVAWDEWRQDSIKVIEAIRDDPEESGHNRIKAAESLIGLDKALRDEADQLGSTFTLAGVGNDGTR